MDIVDTSDARPRGLLVFVRWISYCTGSINDRNRKIAIIGQYVNGRNTIYNIRRRGVRLPSTCASLESYALAMGLSGHLPWDREVCCSGLYYLMVSYLWYQYFAAGLVCWTINGYLVCCSLVVIVCIPRRYEWVVIVCIDCVEVISIVE